MAVFENGDSVTVTVEEDPATQLLAFAVTYQRDGVYERHFSQPLPDRRAPDTVTMQACGGYVQVHAYWARELDPVVMKYRWRLPGLDRQVFLPVVCAGGPMGWRGGGKIVRPKP